MESYNPYEKTALKRKSLSVPMRELKKRNLLVGKVMDFGCGNGDDVNMLKIDGVSIVGYDKFNTYFKDSEKLNNEYDTVSCNYVLNVIPELDEHQEVIEKLRKLSKNVYISVRSDIKSIKDTWEYIEEYKCYKTPKNSYQRFYNEQMVRELIGEVDYIVKNSSLMLFKLKCT